MNEVNEDGYIDDEERDDNTLVDDHKFVTASAGEGDALYIYCTLLSSAVTVRRDKRKYRR